MMAPVIRELMAAGLAGEALLAAVERIEAAQPQHDARSPGAIRTARWRHKASQSVTVTECDVSPSPPASPLNGSPTPLPIITPSPTPSAKPKERARASRLPDDWQPTGSDVTFAATLLRPDRISEEIAKFRDYWHARAGPNAVKRDWSATWRSWCRKAAEWLGNPNGPGNHDKSGLNAAFGRLIASADGGDEPGQKSHRSAEPIDITPRRP